MIIKSKALFFIFIAVLGLQSLRGQADQENAVKFEILLKLLSLNKNFNLAEIDTVYLSMIFDASIEESDVKTGEYKQLLIDNLKLPFKEKPLVISKVVGQNMSSTDFRNSHGIIVLPESERFIKPVLNFCTNSQALSMAMDSTFCSQGVSIVVDYNENSQPEIWFNVTSLNNEGASYDKEILQLVQHLRW
mgnify:CR=1 FL=1